MFPKKIKIVNLDFDVILCEKGYGSFKFATKQNNGHIKIKKNIDKQTQFEIFTHECLEIILELLRVRYFRPDNDSFEFHYDHKSHDLISKHLSAVFFDLFSCKSNNKK